MTQPEGAEPLEGAARTAWHPMLVSLLERFLPDGFQLMPEFQLTRLAQRVDILVVRLLSAAPARPEKLHSILDYLGSHTLIEHKGPTDDIDGGDLLTLMGYAYQYMRVAKVRDPADICLMVVCDRMTPSFLAQAALCRAELHEVERGLWRGSLSGFVLHGIETGKRYDRGPTEHLLYTFSRAYLDRPEGIQPLDPEDLLVYTWLYQQVQQFKRTRGAMAVKDIEVLEKSYEKVLQTLLEQLPPEERLRGLKPEERLRGLGAEERLRGLGAEERLRGLKPEERLRGLKPEERLRGLTPEELAELKRLLDDPDSD